MLIYALYCAHIIMSNPSKIVFEEIDLRLSPAQAYDRLRRGADASCLLESADASSRTVAFSFLGASPRRTLRGDDHQGLEQLREVMASRVADPSPFPFMGGLVGYFSYHLINSVEPDLNVSSMGFPSYELGLYDRGLIYDHSAFKAYHFHPEGEDAIIPKVLEAAPEDDFRIGELVSRTSQRDYEAGVGDIRERILDGEAFQVVLSGHEEHRFTGDPFQLYLRLRKVNPPPYLFYLDFGQRKVLGSSPDTLVTVRGREVITYLSAGPRPLGTALR